MAKLPRKDHSTGRDDAQVTLGKQQGQREKPQLSTRGLAWGEWLVCMDPESDVKSSYTPCSGKAKPMEVCVSPLDPKAGNAFKGYFNPQEASPSEWAGTQVDSVWNERDKIVAGGDARWRVLSCKRKHRQACC